MERYEVRQSIQQSLKILSANSLVKEAVTFLKADVSRRINEQVDIALIPAPSYNEEKRAKYLYQLFKDFGLQDIHIDRFGNVVGVRKGTRDGLRIVIDAHLDTVFPIETVLEPRYEGSRIYMPGINDDASGLAAMLSVIRALNSSNIQTEGDLVFCGIVTEEVGLQGMKSFVSENKFDASISIDCSGSGYFVYGSFGQRIVEIIFTGRNDSVSRGGLPHAIYAAARTAIKLSNYPCPDGTTLTVSSLSAPPAIEQGKLCVKAILQVDIRALMQNDLQSLYEAVAQAAEGACLEENERDLPSPRLPPPPNLSQDTKVEFVKSDLPRVEWDIQTLKNVDAAYQYPHNPLLEALYAIYQGMGFAEPQRISAANSNSAEAIRGGIQGLTMGCGGQGGGVHSADEYFDVTDDTSKGAEAIMLLLLMMAGVPGVAEAQAKNKDKA